MWIDEIMNTKILIDLLAQGKKPMVRLTDEIWDESFGQKGMIARVTKYKEVPDCVAALTFDYNGHREHNLSLERINWYLKDGTLGTAIESGEFSDGNISEEVYVDDTVQVELVEEDTPLSLYLEEGVEIPYIEWLEAKLDELVPDCMKEWKKGLD
jgi:hypothetical protein